MSVAHRQVGNPRGERQWTAAVLHAGAVGCGDCGTEDQSSETVTRSRSAVGAIAHGPDSSEVWCGGGGEKARG